MKLSEDKWVNYSTKAIDQRKNDKYWNENHPEMCELRTASLGEMRDKINWMIDNAKLNHKDIYDIPFLIKYGDKMHVVETGSCGHGKMGMICSLELDSWDELKFTAPDSKPEVGEYWSSRGATSLDVAGFVKSKPAGERLRRLVRYVLEKDETESWLDYREMEPDWIQFKFSAKEFDVKKLDEMTKDTGIITEEILRKCKTAEA